jgi:ParB family chromosome partitioning protein
MPAKRKALGRGLDALLPSRRAPTETAPDPEPAATDVRSVLEVEVDSIVPNPYQPRHIINDDALQELVESIRAQGVIQPILVRRVDQRYQLVAGERRWRAARLAEMTHIPAILVDPSEREMLEWALLENIQREDLNPVEEARAYQTLLGEFGLSQEEVAERVGKQRSSVANSLRLLRLPDNILQDIEDGLLSAGHGRALLIVSDPLRQRELRDEIVRRNLSVRQAEEVANKINKEGAKAPRRQPIIDPHLRDLSTQMSEALGMRVVVKPTAKTRGRIEVHYQSLDDLDRLLDALLERENI